MLKEKINAKAEDKATEISSLREDIGKLEERIKGSTNIKLTKNEFLTLIKTLGVKMRAADVWQKDQIVRKVFTKLILDDKKRLIYRCNEPFDSLFRLTEHSMVELKCLDYWNGDLVY